MSQNENDKSKDVKYISGQSDTISEHHEKG